MHELESLMANILAKGFDRGSIHLPSEWAEKYRIMGGELPGPWSFKNHPWARAMHDSPADVNVGQKAAQMAYSENVMNITFFTIDVLGINCLYVLPTMTPDASRFSNRFDVALDLSEHLRTIFSDVKNIQTKRAGSATLWVGGARSRSSLKSIDPGFVVLDELDEMPEEGINLALRRSDGQSVGRVWMISTPTLPEQGIHARFLQSTQQRWTFKCPICSQRCELIFPDCLVVTGENPHDPDLKRSHVLCNRCKKPIRHEEKAEAQRKTGLWEPTQTGTDAEGWYINQLYSIQKTPDRIGRDYLLAQHSPVAEQELWNSVAGLPHVVKGGALTDPEIEQCVGNWKNEYGWKRKKRYRIRTMGVDVGSWLHWVAGGWRFKKFGADLNIMAQCDILGFGKVKTFNELSAIMHQYDALMCGIDIDPEARAVFEFCVRHYGRAKRIKFVGQGSRRLVVAPDQEVKANAARTFWIDMALGRYRANTIRIPYDFDSEWRTHMKNIVKHYAEDDETGEDRSKYKKMGPDHYALALTYNEIALPLAASTATSQPIGEFL